MRMYYCMQRIQRIAQFRKHIERDAASIFCSFNPRRKIFHHAALQLYQTQDTPKRKIAGRLNEGAFWLCAVLQRRGNKSVAIARSCGRLLYIGRNHCFRNKRNSRQVSIIEIANTFRDDEFVYIRRAAPLYRKRCVVSIFSFTCNRYIYFTHIFSLAFCYYIVFVHLLRILQNESSKSY